MPWCPKCGAEYRPESDWCADCGEELDSQMPEAKPTKPSVFDRIHPTLADTLYALIAWLVWIVVGFFLLPILLSPATIHRPIEWAIILAPCTAGYVGTYFGFHRQRKIAFLPILLVWALPSAALFSLSLSSESPSGHDYSFVFHALICSFTILSAATGIWGMLIGNEAGYSKLDKHRLLLLIVFAIVCSIYLDQVMRALDIARYHHYR